jgi:sulfate/thiosulfate transport system substrate-binding protein
MKILVTLCVAAVVTTACQSSSTQKQRTLTLGAYTTPREVYGKKLIPAFAAAWRTSHGEEITFQESYLGSGAQARAIAGGFEADVAALSLAPDIQTLVRAKLVPGDWAVGPTQGIVSRSIVVLAVRSGNPRGIHDWDDLTKPGLNILTPNVRTSGGAMWNIAAIFGAVMRSGTPANPNKEGLLVLLRKILANVSVMDKGARESLITFEQGVGDVAITYENEVLAAKRAGRSYDYVIPKSTLLIENPAAVVETYATKHHTEDAAKAFVAFLTTPEAQTAYAEFGYRPVLDEVAKRFANDFPAVQDLFTVRDIGGWEALATELFQPGALYEQALKK